MINVAVMGYGTIGSGVVEILEKNESIIARRTGQPIHVKYILDLRDFKGTPIADKIVHDFEIIKQDPEIRIVIETMGGLEPAYTYVKELLNAGKSVATSNKELVATHGTELMKIAEDHTVNFLFEASVGGGIPIVRPLNDSLTADGIVEITGILNGTTNYILTKMEQEGVDFATALKNAQDLGYAERDPSADIEGGDACRKIAILASIAHGHYVNYHDIYTEGISKITDIDFLYAKKLNRAIKLIATSKLIDGKHYAMVAPKLIGQEHPLYPVKDVFNGILVKGKMSGDMMFYGSGAGKLPTASAVVADVIDGARHLHCNILTAWDDQQMELANLSETRKQFFVRVGGEKGAQQKAVEAAFGSVTYIDIEGFQEFGFVTEVLSEEEFNTAIGQIKGVQNRIRFEA